MKNRSQNSPYNLLFIDGVSDNNEVHLKKVFENGSFNVINSGSSDIYEHLKTIFFNTSLLLLDINQQQRIRSGNIDAVFNQISDADTHKITLAKMKNIQEQLGPDVIVLNQPLHVERTTRENIYKLLSGIEKVYVPKTVKFSPKSPEDIYEKIKSENFVLPVIFRVAGKHGGISTMMISEIGKKDDFYPVALDGREYYLTQYVDYRENGVFKKIRLIVVDGKVFIRHVLFDSKWMVHVSSKSFSDENREYIEEEKRLIETFETQLKPHIEEQVNKIYTKVGLDLFGIDCYIDKNFNLLVFEINANMNILGRRVGIPNVSLINFKIDEINSAIEQMILKRIQI